MICKKCGKVLEENEQFCGECGEYVDQSIQKSKRKKSKLVMVGIFLIAIIGGIMLLGNSTDTKNVNIVRDGIMIGSNGIKNGDAFDYFFNNGNWKAFKSTDDKEVVEFTGECTYVEKPATVKIQYTVKDKSFKIHYFEVNGKSKNRLEYLELFKDIEEGYIEENM